jgi:hypothetical protein
MQGAPLRYGVSITDSCIGWEETEGLLLGAAELLAKAPSGTDVGRAATTDGRGDEQPL